ncbi:MAG TPA: phage tail tip lysozyme [Candidatus Saccharimonadales bacterium]|nr:phage tail tip lysozyme [Candidatus Saccharimonadales bacterium]
MKISSKIPRRLLLVLFIAIFSFQPLEALAARDQAYDSSNDVLFYGEGGCKAASNSAGSGEKLLGDDNRSKIWNFLRGLDGNLPKDRALSEEQAAGLMGNIRQEAGEKFDPSATESGGGGYGIVQWTGPRRTNLEKAALAKGVAVSDLGFQLSYLYQESNARKVSSKVAGQGFGTKGANEWTTMMEQVAKTIDGKPRTAIENATVFWHNNFEVSADTADFVLQQRGAFSLEVYTALTGKAAPDGSAVRITGTSGKCSSDGAAFTGGDLTATILAYAWPQYHPPVYTNKKPEYETAIKKAQSEGRYVGGLEYPGVDCGGFVTTLMFDSGFEPKYNYSAKGGNTTSQEKWASENWQALGSNVNAATLQPGDVAFSPGHTFVWAGTIPGFDSKVASASVSFSGSSWRAPMAGHENPTSSSVTWFRKKA